MTARCRLMSGMREVTLVCDLSTHGCCVVTRSIKPVVGMRVLLKTAGFEAMSGIIRWVRDHRCGVEFDAPLYGPVVEHLCRTHLPQPSLHQPSLHQPSLNQPSLHQPSLHQPDETAGVSVRTRGLADLF